MPPRKSSNKKAQKKDSASSQGAISRPPLALMFPEVSKKLHLEPETYLEDQIILVKDFLSPAECKAYVQFIDNLPLELTPPKKRGEASRMNHRISTTSPEHAQRLHEVLSPHLSPFEHPARGPPRLPHSMNSNIRMYKYTQGQYFGQHYDDSVKDSVTGARSEWTLLVYLTGAEDGVQGGETIFQVEEGEGKRRTNKALVPPLSRGMALLHKHGADCLLHEGAPVLKGTKYVLRSDLMFM
ncbi:hypothetical protein BD626DRAFT_500801 [Schizophyllum amplum]|uniref:Fe2OG dioxygenase domain-containing protein n=1 Tax=Schizophyllum amplum TaxID=97359 RepID=A0A550CAQ0_9AGAR|nr:hypothetical protein BD626DRAFT_500801 [Auriculariopsis ampla]